MGISHPLVGRLCEKVPIESVNMCVFSGFFVFQANFAPSFGHRISDLQEVPNPLFHCFLQWICNTSEVGVLKRTRGFRSAGKFMMAYAMTASENHQVVLLCKMLTTKTTVQHQREEETNSRAGIGIYWNGEGKRTSNPVT